MFIKKSKFFQSKSFGNHVKLYQGVTLGDLSTTKGQGLVGIKHPTIEDNVTVGIAK